ncbi:HAD family hydrolase [Aquibacillus rhizosphaerae]|uniref:HAD family hydrolase n=1 Tax=Aquibacillus rhizosphaerae TaxID=3051431 RepID=A0ABT7LFA4_9BACI|nr:HAD family hydrolase [Aquibacillus sp. LR5S19]MDL4843246.1 HAD family hydrolase [Aquibacillus sp. LR5S19]
MDTIIFDVDDTLYDQALSFHHTFRKLVKGQFTYEEIDQIYTASRKYSEILFDQSEAGEISQFEWQTGRIIAACKDFNIPMDKEKATTFHETYVVEQQKITMFDEVVELLDLLHQKEKKLAILTNGEEKHQSMKINQLDLTSWIPVENIFISGTHGHAKPKREIFDIVEKKLGLEPTKTVYIGDSFEKDIVGAKQAGWQAIWMNHRRKSVPTDTDYKPDNEVHSAKDLLDLFVD